MSRSTPPSAMTSASPSFWQVMPIAPRRICIWAIATHLWGFDVGPQANAVLVKVALVAVEVVLQAVEIDEERGRVEVFYTHSGLS